MSWQGYRRVAKPNKAYPCAWCKGIIQAGEQHQRFVGTHEGDFQDWRVHDDCIPPMEKSWDLEHDWAICLSKHNRGSSYCHDSHDYHDRREAESVEASLAGQHSGHQPEKGNSMDKLLARVRRELCIKNKCEMRNSSCCDLSGEPGLCHEFWYRIKKMRSDMPLRKPRRTR